MKTHRINALCSLIIALCYITITEAVKCSPYTGPSGVRECVKFSTYTDYQWTTCRTNSYIRSKTGGKHACINRFYTYCLYQCMLEKYHKESGAVYSSCRCTPGENSASQKGKYTLVSVVLVAITSLLVS